MSKDSKDEASEIFVLADGAEDTLSVDMKKLRNLLNERRPT